MKVYFILLTTLISFGVVNSFKCDEKIVERINKLWDEDKQGHSGLLEVVNIIVFMYDYLDLETKIRAMCVF